MLVPSNLTAKQLRDSCLRGAILFYLRDGETEEGMIEKFKGNLITAVQFLRERSYEGMDIVERKPKVKEKEPKPAKKPKGKLKSSGQEKLF